jgi:hypothetical protein
MDAAKLASTLREMVLLASRLRNNLNDGDPFTRLTDEQNEAADTAIDDAWEVFEEADAELQAADADDDRDDWENDPPDWETQQAERDRREYEAGKAEAETRRAERKIYGDELAERFHAQDDLNAFNRGDDN